MDCELNSQPKARHIKSFYDSLEFGLDKISLDSQEDGLDQLYSDPPEELKSVNNRTKYGKNQGYVCETTVSASSTFNQKVSRGNNKSSVSSSSVRLSKGEKPEAILCEQRSKKDGVLPADKERRKTRPVQRFTRSKDRTAVAGGMKNVPGGDIGNGSVRGTTMRPEGKVGEATEGAESSRAPSRIPALRRSGGGAGGSEDSGPATAPLGRRRRSVDDQESRLTTRSCRQPRVYRGARPGRFSSQPRPLHLPELQAPRGGSYAQMHRGEVSPGAASSRCTAGSSSPASLSDVGGDGGAAASCDCSSGDDAVSPSGSGSGSSATSGVLKRSASQHCLAYTRSPEKFKVLVQVKLGGLGPDFEASKAQRERANRRNSYGEMANARNRIAFKEAKKKKEALLRKSLEEQKVVGR